MPRAPTVTAGYTRLVEGDPCPAVPKPGGTLRLPIGSKSAVDFAVSADKDPPAVAAARRHPPNELHELEGPPHQLHELHREVAADRWCVNKVDLEVFERAVEDMWEKGLIPESHIDPRPEDHWDRRIGPSIYQVNELYIKPTTASAGGMSWALMRHPEGLQCEVFATHCWAEGVFEFLDKVRKAWPIDHEARNLYCCFLANPQNGRGIELMLGSGPGSSPFAAALETARHFLVIPNSKVSIYSRLWCVYEAHLAVEAARRGSLRIALPSTVPRATVVLCSLPGLLLMIFGYLSAYFLLAPFYGVFFQPLVWMLLVITTSPLLGGVWRFASRRSCSSKAAAWSTLWSYWCEMFIIGHGLGLSFWHFRGFANENVVGWHVAHTFEEGEGWACLPLAFALVVLYMSIIVRRVSRSIAQREGNMINFSPVREARCSSRLDERRIKEAIRGREDHIDFCIRILSQAGKYDQALLRNIENGMSHRHAREGANPFRMFIAVWCWEYWWVADLAANAHHIYCVQAPAATCALVLVAWYLARDHAVFAFDMLFFGGLTFVAVSKVHLIAAHKLLTGGAKGAGHGGGPLGAAEAEAMQAQAAKYMSTETLRMQVIGLVLVALASTYHYSGARRRLWRKLGSCAHSTWGAANRGERLAGSAIENQALCHSEALCCVCEDGSDFAEDLAEIGDLGDGEFSLVEAMTPVSCRSRCEFPDDEDDSDDSSSQCSSGAGVQGFGLPPARCTPSGSGGMAPSPDRVIAPAPAGWRAGGLRDEPV